MDPEKRGPWAPLLRPCAFTLSRRSERGCTRVVSSRPDEGESILSTSCEAIEAAVTSPRDEAAPRLAPGVELLGQYEDEGAGEAPYLYRLGDGQAVQVTRLLHLVASRLNGSNVDEIAREVSDEIGRRLSPANVAFLIDQKLGPLGLVARGPHDPGRPSPATPLLGLRFRAALLPAGVVRHVTALLRPLFLPPVVVTVLAALVAIDLWLFFGHGVSEGVREVLHEPVLVPALWGVVGLAGLFHEVGHATACHYGGGRPGRIGFGLYLVWPVFYTDVTDSYRLGRRARLRTDLGGLYFNAIVVLLSAGTYALTGWEVPLVVILIQHMTMLQQLLPFVRLDGYYVVSDLVGVPDLFPYVKPIVLSVVFRRAPRPAVAALGRRARWLVTVWVFVTVPALALSLALLAMQVPEWSAMAAESVTVHMRRLGEAVDEGSVVAVLSSVAETAALVLPLLGVSLTLLLFISRLGRSLSRWVRPRPLADGRDAKVLVKAPLEDHTQEAEPDAKALPDPLPDDQREVESFVYDVTNDHGAHGDSPLLDHLAARPDATRNAQGGGDAWEAGRHLDARLDDAQASIDAQAHELFRTLSRTVEAARYELHLARALRAKAEEEADAIRAAARQDAAELLARTRNGVQSLLQELSQRVDATCNEMGAEPPPTVRASSPNADRSPQSPSGDGFREPFGRARSDAAAALDDDRRGEAGEPPGLAHERSLLLDAIEAPRVPVPDPTQARDGKVEGA